MSPFFVHVFHSWGKSFFEKTWLCHGQKYMGPKHHVQFQKKLISQSQENVWTEGRKDRRMKGWMNRLFQPQARGSVKKKDLLYISIEKSLHVPIPRPVIFESFLHEPASRTAKIKKNMPNQTFTKINMGTKAYSKKSSQMKIFADM